MVMSLYAQGQPGLLGSANVTLAAQAAVAAASSELGAALAGANLTFARSQQQDPEVLPTRPLIRTLTLCAGVIVCV